MTDSFPTKLLSIARAFAADRPLVLLSVLYWGAWSFGAGVFMCQPDCVGYYAYVHSLLVDGDLSLGNELAQWEIASAFRSVTALGQVNDVFACGSAILWLPFVAAMHGILLLARAFGATVQADGHSEPYLQAVSFATSWYGYLALALCYRVAARVATRSVALWATLAIGALTSAWQYLFFDGVLSHTLSAFGDALFVYLAVIMFGAAPAAPLRRPRSSWATLGLAGGLVALLRWQEAVLPASVGFLLLIDMARLAHAHVATEPQRGPRWESRPVSATACYVAGCVVGFFPQLCVWRLQHGSWLAIPQGASFFHPWDPEVAYVLFSSHHGLFTWTPLVLFSVIGFAALMKQERLLAYAAIVAFCMQVYVNSIVLDPAAGISFGSRRFTSLLIFYVVGLASLLRKIPLTAGIALTAFAACWTFPLWIAFRFHLIDPARFVSFEDLYTAVLHAIALLPEVLRRLQPRFFVHANAPLSWVLSEYTLWIVGAGGALVVATRIARSDMRRVNASLVPAGAVALFVNAAFSVAALRSEPLPVRAVQSGHALQLDFGHYANSRFDGNPFDPRTHGVTAYHLPALTLWGDVPFRFLPPPADNQPDPSVMSTCGLPLERFRLQLDSAPTHALHFALGAAGASPPGRPVVTFQLETDRGSTLEKTLRADIEVWDIFKAPPPHAVVHTELTSISGFTLSLDSPLQASAVIIASPFSRAQVWPCVVVYAVTQEVVRTDASEGSRFLPVNLAPVANADHGRNAFYAAARHNYFPQLAPGTMHADGIPFLVLDHHLTPSGQSTLTNAGHASFALRIPLARVSTARLALLLSAWVPTGAAEQLAELEVEYASGPPMRTTVVAGRDVHSYPPGPADQEPRLRPFTMILDSRRVPRYLWLRRPKVVQSNDAGIAIFAVTQLPDAALTPSADSVGQ